MYSERPVVIAIGTNSMIEFMRASAEKQCLRLARPRTIPQLEVLLRTHADYGGVVLIGASDDTFANGDQASFEAQVVDRGIEEGFVVALCDSIPQRLMAKPIPYLSPRRRRFVRLAAGYAPLETFQSLAFRERMQEYYPRAAHNIRANYHLDSDELIPLMGDIRCVIHHTQNV